MKWALCTAAGLWPLEHSCDEITSQSTSSRLPNFKNNNTNWGSCTMQQPSSVYSAALQFFALSRAEQSIVWMCVSLYIYMFTLSHKKILRNGNYQCLLFQVLRLVVAHFHNMLVEYEHCKMSISHIQVSFLRSRNASCAGWFGKSQVSLKRVHHMAWCKRKKTLSLQH